MKTQVAEFSPDVNEAIDSYCRKLTDSYLRMSNGLTEGSNEYRKQVAVEHHASIGRKFRRITRVETRRDTGKIVSECAVAFVDAEGNIWKPAGWKGPALNFPRGNVLRLGEYVSWAL